LTEFYHRYSSRIHKKYLHIFYGGRTKFLLPQHPIDRHSGGCRIAKFVGGEQKQSFDSLHDIRQIVVVVPDFLVYFVFADTFQSFFGYVIMYVMIRR